MHSFYSYMIPTSHDKIYRAITWKTARNKKNNTLEERVQIIKKIEREHNDKKNKLKWNYVIIMSIIPTVFSWGNPVQLTGPKILVTEYTYSHRNIREWTWSNFWTDLQGILLWEQHSNLPFCSWLVCHIQCSERQ